MLPISSLFSLKNIDPLALGFFGESLMLNTFKSLGYPVETALPYFGDLVIGATFLEIKTIRRSKNGCYSATIRKNGSEHLLFADYVVILIIEDNTIYPYIIPTKDLEPDLKRIHITSHPNKYAGKYNKYRNNWNPLLMSL